MKVCWGEGGGERRCGERYGGGMEGVGVLKYGGGMGVWWVF